VYRYLQRRRYAPAVSDTYRRILHPPKEMLSQSKQAMALRELLQAEARDGFYKTPFQPKNFADNFLILKCRANLHQKINKKFI
jgi:hypothetical protein